MAAEICICVQTYSHKQTDYCVPCLRMRTPWHYYVYIYTKSYLFAVSLSIKMYLASKQRHLCERLWGKHILKVICECMHDIAYVLHFNSFYRFIKNYRGDKMLLVKLRQDLNA